MNRIPGARVRPLALAVLLALAAPIAMQPLPAQAQTAQQQYDLAEGPLDATLTAIARRSGMVLSFPPELVKDKQAPAVRGYLDAESAIRLALSYTNLQLVTTSGGTLTIEPMPETGTPVLSTVLVRGNHQGIDREMLERMPNKSGTIEDALGLLPGVQTSSNAQRSLQGGEIKPPLISIAGGKPNESRYIINGLGNNNYVIPPRVAGRMGYKDEPAYNQTFGDSSEPIGMAQGYNLNTELLENIEVYDSRIPVNLSGFTGGVVSADTRKPDTQKFSGNIYWRHSRSDWDKIFYDEVQLRGESFDQSYDASRQPEYIRNSGGVMLNIPLNDRFASIISYDLTHSRIPLSYVPGDAAATYSRDQTREAHTFFTSVGGKTDSGLDLNLTGVYYKYKGNYYNNYAINSEYDQEQETYDLALSLSKVFDAGKASAKVKYGNMSSRRDVESNTYMAWQSYGDKNWGYPSATPGTLNTDPNSNNYGRMGSWGWSTDGSFYADDLDYRQRTLQTSLDFEFNERTLGATKHKFAVGLDSEIVWGKAVSGGSTVYNGLNWLSLDRPLAPGQDAVSYNWDRTNGQLYDQYIDVKDVTDPFNRTASTQTWSLWLQDTVTFSDFMLRPGVRLDYDDQFKNYNVAPRLAADWNVLGKNTAILHAGVARYYGGPNLYYALYKDLDFSRYTRSSARNIGADGMIPWKHNRMARPGTEYDAQDMKTPYSDELSLGLDLALPAGFSLDYNFIKRHGKDGITRRVTRHEDGTTQTVASNDGENWYTGHTISISNSYFKNHYFRVGTNFTDSKSNYIDYMTEGSNYLDESRKLDRSRVMYNGTLMDMAKLDMSEFNRPLQIIGYYQGRLTDRIDLATTITWSESSPALISNPQVTLEDGWKVASYTKEKLSSRFVIDLSLGVDVFKQGDQALRVTLDVFNALNAKHKNGGGMYYGPGNVPVYYDYYAPGRSIMGRLDYRF